MLNHKRILITGGTGSLGRQLTRTILEKYQPRRLVVYSRDELKQYEMAQEISPRQHPCLRYFLGDVRDQQRLTTALNKIDYVIHTAALKQVPAAEYNPFEFVKTNVLGAQNLVEAAMAQGVARVIALSTDKAANPINLYGATKLCADKLFLAANAYYGECRFSVVRYGNVFGSRGSAIPLFRQQMKSGEVTLTDARMTRFIITRRQAADFVLQSLEGMTGNEIFIPKIPSLKITDLIPAVAPGCRVRTIGIRPGEKLHEMLVSTDEARYCYDCGSHFVLRPASPFILMAANAPGALVPPDFSYTSNGNAAWLGQPEIRELLAEND